MGRITTDQLDELLGMCLPGLRPSTYIETGAHTGERLLEVQSRFETVVGIELDPVYALKAARRVFELGDDGWHIEVVRGDSRQVLADLLGELGPEPLFVHLDAHFCKADPPPAKEGFPLWTELDLLSLYPGAMVVSVDDVHTFGRERPELRATAGPEWEAVTADRIRGAFCPRRIYASHQVADELVLFLGVEL